MRQCDECGEFYDAPGAGSVLRYLSDGPGGREWTVASGGLVVHRCRVATHLSVRHPTVHGRWLRSRAVLVDALDDARRAAGAPMGSAQLVVGNRLHLVESEGFPSSVLPLIAVVGTHHDSVCRAAFATGRTIAVDDVECSGFYTPTTRDAVRWLGIRAVLSAPVLGPDGAPVAMLAVHRPEPEAWSDDVVDTVDRIVRRCGARLDALD